MRKAIRLLNNHKLVITNDEYAESPNEWQNEEMFLVYEHRQFDVRREGFKPVDIYDFQRELTKAPTKQDMNSVYDFSGYYIYQVNAYIHSGITLSLQSIGDKWDTSTTGFILVSRDLVQTDEEAQDIAQKLITRWNKYLGEEVYRFELYERFPYKKQYLIAGAPFDDEIYYDEECIDSCGGYECEKFSEILEDIDANLWNEDIVKLVNN